MQINVYIYNHNIYGKREEYIVRDGGIEGKIFNAAKWSTVTEIITKLISPITNMILARIVAPEAFGIVATITMIISFADMFTDAGFQKYLVQHEFKSEEEKFKSANVAFWTNFGVSIILWLLIIIFRDDLAKAVGNPGLGNVIAIACVQLLLTSFSSIQMALYRRDFDFKALFIIRLVYICIPFVVTIPLAFCGFGYWSLIIGTICMQLYNAVVLTIKSKWKPYMYYDISVLKEMISFSVWSLIEAVSIWFTGWVDIFIIGNSLSQNYLGIYKISISMVDTIMNLITASFVPVLFSALCRMQKDKNKFNNMYFEIQRLVSIFVFPLGIGVFLYSDLITRILLGKGWEGASTVIGLWSLTSSITIVLGNLASEVYRAKGKPKLSFLAQLLHLVVLAPTCIIAVKYGFNVLVTARAWIRIEAVIVHLIIMSLVMKISILNTVRNIIPTAISTIAMGIIGVGLQQLSNNTFWTFISMGLCAIVYFCILYTFPSMRKDMKKVVGKVKIKLSKKTNKLPY